MRKTIIYCDKCKKEIDKKYSKIYIDDKGPQYLPIRSYNQYKFGFKVTVSMAELCTECFDSLKKWWNS